MIEIVEQSVDTLAEYGSISIAFEVRRIFDVQVIDRGLGGFVLVEQTCEPPYVKDSDASEGDRPVCWADPYADFPNEVQLVWYKDLGETE